MKEKFTYLQKKELMAAEKSGLQEEQIRILTNPSFNYLQMREIRKAMENGMEESQLKLLARPWIHADEMHAIVTAVQQGEKVESTGRKKRIHISPVLLLLPAFLLISFLLFQVHQPEEPLELALMQDEITVSCGEVFDPAKYVKKHSGTNAVLKLPEGRTLEQPGTWIFSYEIGNGKENIQKLLRVNVADHQSPVIRLKQEEAVIYKGIPFSCHAYVESAVDELDGSLSQKVECSDELQEGDQDVLYKVKDSFGNEGTASMKVHYVDPLEEAETPLESREPENNADTQENHTVPVSTAVAETETYSVPLAKPTPLPQPEYTYETETIEQWSEEVQSQEVTVEHSFS